MAFIFTMRSTPIGGHRRGNSTASTLPAIDEDNASFINRNEVPPVPPKAWNRPQRQAALGLPFGWEDSAPPAYSFDSRTGKGSNSEKLAELRKGVVENRRVVQRGGWRRIALILLAVLVALAVGLGVGLGVGLRKKNSGSSQSSADSGSSSAASGGGASGTAQPAPNHDAPANATFPVGSYTFNTYLSTVAANCTSNPSTWMCYPYSTYAQSPSSSSARFDWIIRSSSSSSQNLTISSTPNPFSILFTDTPLRLNKAGQEDEHYFFQLSMTKPTKPTTQLGSENVAATCSFDDTTLQAYLYTKLKKTYPMDEQNVGGGFQLWPGAVKVEQVTGGTVGNPKCVDQAGTSLGEFGVEDGTQLCDCLWLNTGT